MIGHVAVRYHSPKKHGCCSMAAITMRTVLCCRLHMGIWPKSPEGKGQLWTDYQKCCRQQSESGTCSVHPLHFGQTIKLPERFTELWLYTSDSGRQWRFISDVSDTVFAWMGFTVHFRVLMNYGFQAQTTVAYILTDPLIICVILGKWSHLSSLLICGMTVSAVLSHVFAMRIRSATLCTSV